MPILKALTSLDRLSKTNQFSAKLPANSSQIPGSFHFKNLLARIGNGKTMHFESYLEVGKNWHKELECDAQVNEKHPSIFLCNCPVAKSFRAHELGIDYSSISVKDEIWRLI